MNPDQHDDILNRPVDALLQREVPLDYLTDWQQVLLQSDKYAEEENYQPLVVFRLYDEYFAITTSVIGEITHLRAVHRLPHSNSPFIEGIVNVSGRLREFISMEKLLQLSREQTVPWKIGGTLVLFEKDGNGWTFIVTEMLGVSHVFPEMMQEVPATVALKPVAHYMKGLFSWKGHSIAILDEEILALRMRHSL